MATKKAANSRPANYFTKQKQRTVPMAKRQKLRLMFGSRLVAEVEFDVLEQSIAFSVYGRGFVSNPVMLSVDTQMLGHTETDE